MATADEGVRTWEIQVHLVENRKTGLLVALSDELKGLMVAARSEEQIEAELPDAIREILEASGYHVLSVTAEPGPRGLPPEFSSPLLIASARVAT
jgi:hypothetical protein